MKKAKIILAFTAIFAVIGGAFSFKANRFSPSNIWYIPIGAASTTISTTLFNGQVYSTTIPNCTPTCMVTTGFGILSITYTSTTSPLVTTIFTRAGGQTFITTYHYCTTILTRYTPCDI